MAKRAIIILAAVVALLGTIAVVLPKLVDINQYRGRIQAELESRLGRKVAFGALSLSVIPLSVSVADLVIQEAPVYKSKLPFATASRLEVRLGLLALLTGNVEVSALNITRPAIELIRAPNGKWNYETLGSGQGDGGGGGVSLHNVTIDEGRIGVTDLASRKPRAVYAPIDIDVREYTPGQRFDLDVAARLPGKGDEKVQASLRGTKVADMEGSVKLDNATLSSLWRFTGSEAGSLDGVATGDVELRGQGGLLSATGELGLRDGKVKGQPLGYNVDTNFDLTYDDSKEFLTLKSLSAKLGSLPLSAAGTFDMKSEPMRVNANVRTANASITEVARLAGVSGADVKGTLSANIVAQGAMPRPALSGSVDTSALEIRGGQIKETVKTSPLKLTLTPGLIRSEPFTAQAGATSLNGSFTLAEYTGAAPVLDLSLKAPNAQLSELLDIAKAFGAGADDVDGTGAVSLDIRAQGKLAKDAPMAISGAAGLRKATLMMPSLAKPLGIRQADVQFRQIGDRSDMKFNAELDDLVVREGGEPAKSDSSGGALDKITGGGRVTLASVTYGKVTIQKVTADCNLDRGIIKLAPITASAYSGRQSGSITIDTRGASTAMDIKMQVDKVDADQFLAATTSLKRTLQGLLDTKADVHITPKPGEEMASALNGTASIKLNQGKLQGISLMNEAAGVAKILGFRKHNDVATSIVDLMGDFQIANGVARTDNLAMKLEDGSATATGTINLATQSVDMRVLVAMGKGLSQQFGGNSIGGLLSTAFGNEKGEILVPMMVSGTMDKVRVTPDAQRAASMKLQGLTGGKGANPAETVDKVKGLFDAFRKKK